MNMTIFDRKYDEVIKCAYLTVGTDYEFALSQLVPLIDKLDFQRNPLRASFYKRLERDILDGCIMPPLTIAINRKIARSKVEAITPISIKRNLPNAFVLDGIQRLNTLSRISNDDGFDGSRPLYVNILICDSMDRLLYRMITLNNGQRPMTARHQIEVLASNVFNFEDLPILAVSEKEAKRNRGRRKADDSEATMSKEILIKGYLAFISDSVNIDNQKIIESKMDELITEQIMESNLITRKTEYKDVIDFINPMLEDEYLREWFSIPNNFIGFSAAMAMSFDTISEIDIDDLAESIQLFETAFSSIDVSKIKLGMARRRMVKYYFNHYEKLSSYSVNGLLDVISQEI